MNKKNISLRVDNNLLSKIDKIAKLSNEEKSYIYRKALKIGLKDISKELAIKLFAEGKFSFSEGAELSNMYIGEKAQRLKSS